MDATLRYTQLGFAVSALLDKGEKLGYEETVEHIANGTLFGWLKDRFGDTIDLSLYGAPDWSAVLARFSAFADAVDSRRKFGAGRNGLALLAAYCFAGLQEIVYPSLA